MTPQPKKTQVKPEPKKDAPGKPLSVTGKPRPFDGIDAAEPPCSPETAEQGYVVVEKPNLGKRR